MRAAIVVALFAMGTAVHAEPASMPWLRNLGDVRAVSVGEPFVAMAMDAEIDPSCDESMSTGLALVANVAPGSGSETVLASFAHGVMVYGREGELIAATPGFPCAGSADEIEVLAAGTAFGVPLIAITATTGGRREQLTWVGLYRIGLHGRLEAVFTGAVEQREDGIVRRGSITILPGALLVRDPLGGVGFWVIDPVSGVYVPSGGFGASEYPHS
jgi:hypothetical protein